MGQYLKLFKTHTDYTAAENGLLRPNVSYCEQENELHYNEKLKVLLAKKSSDIDLQFMTFVIDNKMLYYRYNSQNTRTELPILADYVTEEMNGKTFAEYKTKYINMYTSYTDSYTQKFYDAYSVNGVILDEGQFDDFIIVVDNA